MAVPTPRDNFKSSLDQLTVFRSAPSLRVKPELMPANVRQLITRHCKRISRASIAQRWLEVERAIGIENTAPDPLIS
jgi:hypothetical protein